MVDVICSLRSCFEGCSTGSFDCCCFYANLLAAESDFILRTTTLHLPQRLLISLVLRYSLGTGKDAQVCFGLPSSTRPRRVQQPTSSPSSQPTTTPSCAFDHHLTTTHLLSSHTSLLLSASARHYNSADCSSWRCSAQRQPLSLREHLDCFQQLA